MIIESILGTINEIELKGRAIDWARLSHEEMGRPHQKIRTEGGRELKVSLPHGENLFCGAVLFMDDETVAAVDMVEEEVFELRPGAPLEWAKAAYNIGNMHQSAYLYEDCIRVPYDPVLERMMAALKVPCRREKRKLDGLRAVVSVGHGDHHHHDDDHGRHDHHHGE